MSRTVWIAVGLGALALAGCGDDEGNKQQLPPGMAPGASPPPAAGAPGAVAAPTAPGARVVSAGGVSSAPAGAGADPAKEAVLVEVRKRGFKNEDFVEGPTNRDPFHSFLNEFSGSQQVTTQYEILEPKYSLDELKLVAIVGPPTVDLRGRPVAHGSGAYGTWSAMFLDPSQKGVSVVRGNHISKADAKVTRIAGDRVFFEMKEDLGGGKSRTVERVIELHAGEPASSDEE